VLDYASLYYLINTETGDGDALL